MTGPGFWTTVGLIVRLRFQLLSRRLTAGGRLGGVVAVAAVGSLAVGLGVGSYLLFSAVPAVATSRVWMAFFLGLFTFLLGVFWVLWPLVAAQVDEAYELGRYLHYPVRPARLYLIHTAVGLLEPAVVFFYPALIGAGLGLHKTLAPGVAATVGLMACFALMNVALGRCLLNFLLNVMTSRRSAELLFAAFLAALAAAALMPPVDASWLFAQLESMTGADDLTELVRATGALSDTPPGWLAYGLRAAAMGRLATAWATALGMLTVGAGAWLLGLLLLKRFYRGGRELIRRRARKRPPRAARIWQLPGLRDETAAVFAKEWRTMTGNPKGRMLFAVPFFLLLLLRVVGAPQFLGYLWGEPWAAMLLSLLALYVLAVLAGQFFVNGFGYDGPAIRAVFLAPAPTDTWLRGRNLAQGLFATTQVVGLGLMLYLLLPRAATTGLALPICAFPAGLLVLLAVGNLLSARYPQRYHLSLARRDRPVGAAFAAVLATLGACVTLTVTALWLADRSGLPLRLPLALLPLLGALAYILLLPIAARRTNEAREQIISAIL
ncbi:MAG: hypothetical protein ABI333_13140 [bacterium]